MTISRGVGVWRARAWSRYGAASSADHCAKTIPLVLLTPIAGVDDARLVVANAIAARELGA